MSFTTFKIEDLKDNVQYACVGGPFGSDLTSKDYVDEGVPVIRGANLPDDLKFRDNSFVFVSEQKAATLISNTAYPGDLVFTQRGTLGQIGLIPLNARYDRYVVSQSQMKLTVDKKKVLPEYLFYYFRQQAIIQAIRGRAITSGVPHINLTILKRFEVILPKTDTQKQIVKVLSAYDSLIENNNRRISLLEESARFLFREWFVYLRFPGHEHLKAVDGVPEGWERKVLGSKIVLNYGKALKAEHRIEGNVLVYGSSGVIGTHEKALIKGPGIIVGRKGNVGSVFWSDSDFYPIDTVYYIDSESSTFHLYHALQNMQFVSNDAAVPGLNRDFAYSRPYLEPAPKIAKLFEETVTPIYEQIIKLKAYNDKLKQARDLLLPRLMSGEITV